MSNKYERITIKPIKTGFLVEREDRNYYDGDSFAFATWAEVIEFIKDKPVTFLAEENKETSSDLNKIVDLEKVIAAS